MIPGAVTTSLCDISVFENAARPAAATRGSLFAGLLGLLLAVGLMTPALAQQEEGQGRPGIGITGFTAPDGLGAGVSTVLQDSGAAEAGLRPGDIITQVDDTEVDSIEALAGELTNYEVGDTVSITYLRGTEENTVDVTLQPVPALSGEDLPFFGEPDPFPTGEPPERDRGSGAQEDGETGDVADYLGVIILFGVLICGFLGTLTILKIKDRKKAAGESPLDVARMRYAKGEITREQFQNITFDLEGKTPPPGGSASAAPPSGAGETEQSKDEDKPSGQSKDEDKSG